MLRFLDRKRTLCDGVSRREFLRIGGLAPLGLSLPQLLASERKSTARAKQCLLVYMEGGPSHIDLFDMKPNAPVEIRGELKPVPTRVPGLQISELLPRLSQQMHHLSVVRSMTHKITDHNAGTYYSLTGQYPVQGTKLIKEDSPRNFPSIGGVVSKLRPTRSNLPDYVHVAEIMSNLGVDIAGQSGGFLGPAHDPFITGDPSLPNYRIPGLAFTKDLTLSRLQTRGNLLRELDQSLGKLSEDPKLERADYFTKRAMALISSPEVRKAFDLSQEPMRVRERYGMDPGSNRSIEARKFGGLPHLGQSMLLARRLLEAGTRLVTLVTGRRIDQAWDTHRKHFPLLRRSLCPMFDQSFSALLEDLSIRGLLKETLVVVFGEFGRTPKIGQIVSNAGADRNGRDHWPYCYTIMAAGAGVPAGAVHGASDNQGAYPSEDPYTPEDLVATIYSALGISPETEIRDSLNRPYTLVRGTPMRALLG